MEKKKINIAVIGAIILIIFSFFTIFRLLYLHRFNLNLTGIENIKEKITINAILNNKTNERLLVCYEDSCSSFIEDSFLNVLTSSDVYAENIKKVNKISITYPKNIDMPYKEISLYVGNKHYLYNENDLKTFEKKDITIKYDIDEKEKTYHTIILPEINNLKSNLSQFSILFLSLFYNWQIFIIPYIWLIIGFIILSKKIKIKLNPKLYKPLLYCIFGLGIIFRVAQFSDCSLYLDEIYTKITISKGFLACFNNPYNPPLFYVLEYFMSKFSNQNNIDMVLKILPFTFSILFPYFTYKIFKLFDKKTVLIGTFIASFSLINIYHSNDIYNYSLCILLGVLGVYLTIKYLNKPNRKNLVYYTIYALLAIYSDFIFIFFILSNLFWIVASLSDNKTKDLETYNKTIRYFLLSNAIIFLMTLPYLIKGIFKESIIDTAFNFEIFSNMINLYFRNHIIFFILSFFAILFIVIFFSSKNLKNKIQNVINLNYRKEEFFIYLIYTIVFIIITLSIISTIYKPILNWKTIFDIWSILFLTEVIFISIVSDIKPKYIAKGLCFILFLILFAISNPTIPKNIFRTDNFVDFVIEDSNKYYKNYDIHVIIDNQDIIENYSKLKKLDYINFHFTNGDLVEEIKRSDYIKNGKGAIIYCNNLSCNIDKISFLNQNLYLYKTNTTQNAKIIFKEKI